MRILVVDDDRRLPDNVRLKVAMTGHTVVGATTLAEARQLSAGGSNWDIITLDGHLLHEGDPQRPPDTLPLVDEFKARGCSRLVAASNNPDQNDRLMSAGCTHRCESKTELAKLVQQLVG